MPAHLTIVERGSGRVLLEGVETGDPSTTVRAALCKPIHQRYPKYHPARQRLTVGQVVLEPEAPVSKYRDSLVDGATITLKDLGPQVDWTTVFVIEYLGPLLIHPLFYFCPSIFYPGVEGAVPPKTWIQTASFLLILLHFAKREVETLWVHRFSNDTMPAGNLFKNCIHYWGLSGVLLAYPLYAPTFQGGMLGGGCSGVVCRWSVLAMWAWAELSNLATHLQLRHLRPPGTRERRIPRGYGFELVSCPNYLFEAIAWVAFTVLNGSVFAALFTVAGAVQMLLWALKKHARYRKDFKDYPRRRKAMIPFLL